MAANDASVGSRHRLARWGGGALAASMALVALFMARYQAVDESAPAASAVAAQSSAPSPAPAEPTVTSADAAGLVVVATVASAPLRTESPRRSATRTRQAARATAAARAEREPVRVAAASALPPVPPPSAPVLAAQAQPLPSTSPFLPPADETPAARPWPRSSLPQYPATGMFSAGLSSSQAGRSFYPFEPRLSSPPPAETAEPSRQE
ncbi:hypothetical protein [Pseudoxanthomonas mexicana]|uniref:hypothetical protein n=1 Tax=Pseudoxanthomonas mexicana TaxID=128785 RepID=UPI00398A79B3